MKARLTHAFLFLAALLQGCAGISTKPLVPPGADSIFAYKPVIAGRETETALSTVHLGTLLSEEPCAGTMDVSQCLAYALRVANNTASPFKRNRIQDYLIASSNEQCRIYQGRLRTAVAEPNFWLGTGTTIFGAAGAIAKSSEGAKLLSGLAAILSGTRAEFNQDFFANQTADVLIGSINSARKEMLEEIGKSRGVTGAETVEKYTIERAVADAVDYHSKCSIASALQHAGKALAAYDDIGIKRFNDYAARAEVARLSVAGNTVVSTADWVSMLAARIDGRAQELANGLANAIQRYNKRHSPDLNCAMVPANDACKAAADGRTHANAALALLFKTESMLLNRTKFSDALQAKVSAVHTTESELANALSDGAKATAKANLDNARTGLELTKRTLEGEVAAKLVSLATEAAKIDAYMK